MIFKRFFSSNTLSIANTAMGRGCAILIIALMLFTEHGQARQQIPQDIIPGMVVFKTEPLNTQPGAGKQQTLDGSQGSYDDILPGTIPARVQALLNEHAVVRQARVMPGDSYREAHVTMLNRGMGAHGEMPDDLTRTFIVHYDSGENPHILARKLASLPGIAYAEPLFVYEITALPNDPLLDTQGHDYFSYQAFYGAWDVSKSSEDVVIAIVDSGVDYTHEDLQSKLWRNPEPGRAREMFPEIFAEVVNDTIGWDFWRSGPIQNPVQSGDPMGVFEDHGTHVAGTAAADTDNRIGIAGTGWKARFMAVKVGGTQEFPRSIGFGYQGILYAAVNGADVINCSWGGSNFSAFGQDVVRFATAMGSLVVGAAGNANSENRFYPAGLDGVLAVGSVDHRNGLKSSFSNFGYTVDVMASGTAILSTSFNNRYILKSGTSMATPVVSGLAALIRSHRPDWGPGQIAAQIRSTATRIDAEHSANLRYKLGNGVINAQRALGVERPGVRVLSVEFVNMDGDKLDIGEQGQIRIRIRNDGRSTSGLRLVLESMLQGIDVSSDGQTPANLATGEVADAVFNVRISPGFNLSLTPRFLLLMQDDAAEYDDFAVFLYDDILYDIHDANKVLTSVSTTGTVGFLNALTGTGGVGFIPFNEETGNFSNPNILFEGALMIETYVDSLRYNLDQARAENGLSNGFTPLSAFQFRNAAANDLPATGKGRFTTLRPGGIPHIDVQLETFSYTTPGLDQSIIFKYSVTNLSGGRLNQTRVGLFNDWDIPPYFENSTGFDTQGNFLYVISSDESMPLAAVANIGPIESAIAIDNRYSGAQDSLRFGLVDGFSNQKKSWSLRAGTERTRIINTDVSVVTASGPFDIEPEATAVIGFIYAYGYSLNELRTQIANAREAAAFRVSAPGLVVKEDGPFSEIPERTWLYQNYPNPFNPSTNIRFYLDAPGVAVLSIYDLLGRRVATLADGPRSQGSHTLTFNAGGLGSGVYLMVLEAEGRRQTRKMLLLR